MTTQPSKPRIKKHPRLYTPAPLWICYVESDSCDEFIGLGYTPAQAYEDWKKGRVR